MGVCWGGGVWFVERGCVHLLLAPLLVAEPSLLGGSALACVRFIPEYVRTVRARAHTHTHTHTHTLTRQRMRAHAHTCVHLCFLQKPQTKAMSYTHPPTHQPTHTTYPFTLTHSPKHPTHVNTPLNTIAQRISCSGW